MIVMLEEEVRDLEALHKLLRNTARLRRAGGTPDGTCPCGDSPSPSILRGEESRK